MKTFFLGPIAGAVPYGIVLFGHWMVPTMDWKCFSAQSRDHFFLAKQTLLYRWPPVGLVHLRRKCRRQPVSLLSSVTAWKMVFNTDPAYYALQ